MEEQLELPGLGNEPRDKWPEFDESAPIMERLAPRSELHGKVLAYVKERLDLSERAMSRFYDRWRVMERKVQAYIDLPKYDEVLRQENDKGRPAQVVSITLPYIHATIASICTYLIHTFAGRKPMFQIGTYRADTVQNARSLETCLQYNADHTRLIKKMWQWIWDSCVCGVGVLRTEFRDVYKMRATRLVLPQEGMLGLIGGGAEAATQERRLVYQGNEVRNIDPFMFFPDPRVPMTEVNREGEFVFWRDYIGRHELKKWEADGLIAWLDNVGALPRNEFSSDSERNLRAGGIAGTDSDTHLRESRRQNYVQVDQGTIEIIPAELGLGAGETPEKWIFTLGNKCQILDARPFAADHDMHPVAVIEPFGYGYGFGQMGMADFLAPMQDTMSWLINSTMENARTAMNNMFVFDPSRVEMQDLKNPGPGKLIRLKRAAYGQDPNEAIRQLAVQDVTSGNWNALQAFGRIGDQMSAVTDNMRGVQDSGGRKTATEVRTSGEAAASRLAALARLVSAQGVTDLTEQMAVNLQQYLTPEFEMMLLGADAATAPISITPDTIAGDFYYPIHDGTLPLDKVALLDVWKEILMGVAGSPILSQQFNLVTIFEYVAQLGGAKNIEEFKLNVAAPGQAGIPGVPLVPGGAGGAGGVPGVPQ